MILAAQYATVSDIEVVWTAIAVYGAALSISNVRHAIVDVTAARTIGNGRRWIASASLQVELARLVIQLFFISMGVLAMTIPEPPTAVLPTKLVIFGALFRWGLIISSSLITFQSWTNRQMRIRVLDDEDVTGHRM